MNIPQELISAHRLMVSQKKTLKAKEVEGSFLVYLRVETDGVEVCLYQAGANNQISMPIKIADKLRQYLDNLFED